MQRTDVKIHTTAEVSEEAEIGEGTRIWNWVQVRENSKIGKNCILSKGVYIDANVVVGDNVKIQNNVSVYHGVTLEDGVFAGPHVCFTNDKNPRAISEDESLKSADDWAITPILVKKGASIGANSTILPGVTIGEYALIGAGSVVTKDIPAYALAFGSPARVVGEVDKAGSVIKKI